MIQINAMGEACPAPVVKTHQAIRALTGPGVVETLVDNEVAVQNLTKMANQGGYGVKSEQLGPQQFKVTITVENAPAGQADAAARCPAAAEAGGKKVVVAVGSDKMGHGSDDLGKALLKSFLYALSQQEELPATILFYNGGAAMTCQESPALEDLQSMAERGVEILTCGTCLNHYGLTDQLKVGEVTNMYVIVEKLTQAGLVVKP